MIAIFGYAVLLKYTGWIIAAIWSYCVLRYGLPALAKTLRERRFHVARERQRLLRNADAGNREWLEDGIYEGDYPAATMPLTRPEQQEWYDYDDGLSSWR